MNEIKAEACGAIRNLAIEGGAEVCAEVRKSLTCIFITCPIMASILADFFVSWFCPQFPVHPILAFLQMFNKSIVTKLQPQITIVSQALNNYLQGVKPKNEDEIRIRKVLWSWIEHLSTVFWCLAWVSNIIASLSFSLVLASKLIDPNNSILSLNPCYLHSIVNSSETSDKAFKAIVTIQPLSDLLYQILKNAVPVDGSPASSSKIPANVALAAGELPNFISFSSRLTAGVW